MKILYFAYQNLKYDIGFVLLLLLELLIGIFFLASSLGNFYHLYEQITLCNSLHLDKAVYTNEELNDRGYYDLPNHISFYHPYKEEKINMGLLSPELMKQLCIEIPETNEDVLPVIINERLSDIYQINKTYTMVNSDNMIQIKVIGTYDDINEILDKNEFSAQLISEIYQDVLCSENSNYWKKHSNLIDVEDALSGNISFFQNQKDMETYLLKNPEAYSMQKEWIHSFWGNKDNVHVIMTSIIFILLSISAVISSKALRVLHHRKQDSILRITGSSIKQLLFVSFIEDSIIFLLLFLMILPILKIKEYVLSVVNSMSIVYLSEHPQWEFLGSLVQYISFHTLIITIALYFILYICTSSIVYLGLSKKSIAEAYSDLQ